MLISEDIRIIQPSGFLSAKHAEGLLREFKQYFEQNVKIVLIDLQQVDFIDSSGLGLLVQMHAQLRLAGRRLCICSARDQAKVILDISDMDTVLEIFVNQEAFFESIIE
jgi:anti-anti-sigma factor